MSNLKMAILTLGLGGLIGTGSLAMAHDEEVLRQSPPSDPYIQVSDALPLPEFIYGLGTLFVDPDTFDACQACWRLESGGF
jgi:hypothetical protein